MVALYVILILAALIICLLFTNIKISFSYKDQLSLKVKYFITVFDNNKRKPETKKKASKKQEATTSKLKQLEGYFKSFDSTIVVFKLIKGLLSDFGKFLKRVRVYNTEIALTVVGSDAAATAINYGACCSVVYPLVTLLSKTVIFSPKQINITSDFTAESFSVGIYTDISVKPIYVIIFAISFAISYIKLRIERNKK